MAFFVMHPHAPFTAQVRLASVRRSLFSSETERTNFLSRQAAQFWESPTGHSSIARTPWPACVRRNSCPAWCICCCSLPFRHVSHSLPALPPLPCPFGRLVNGTRDLLRQQSGLAHHANYHEFCRLLGRLKANYQLSELVRCLDKGGC